MVDFQSSIVDGHVDNDRPILIVMFHASYHNILYKKNSHEQHVYTLFSPLSCFLSHTFTSGFHIV